MTGDANGTAGPVGPDGCGIVESLGSVDAIRPIASPTRSFPALRYVLS